MYTNTDKITCRLYRLVCYKYKQLLFCQYATKGNDEGLLYRSLAHEAKYAKNAFAENKRLNVYQSATLAIYNHLQTTLLDKTEELLRQRTSHLNLHQARKKLNEKE